ncbi:MAG: MarR family transcriptional regulator [Angelakisella sp.]|jgi:MarR family transcriptional repressor of mepA|nr:MarR family transcriptional regulator [Angelakisella sp.]
MYGNSTWLFSEKTQRAMEFLRLYRLLHNAMQQEVDRALRQMGADLTSAQLDTLICVAHGCGGPVNQRDIEEQLKLSNPTVTGILKRMERKGLITRVVGSRDRRCKEVRLTEKCARLGERLHPKAGTMIDQMFQGFTQEEFDTLNCLLRRLLENCGQVQEEKHPCKALAAVSKIMYSGGTV